MELPLRPRRYNDAGGWIEPWPDQHYNCSLSVYTVGGQKWCCSRGVSDFAFACWGLGCDRPTGQNYGPAPFEKAAGLTAPHEVIWQPD